MRYLATSLCVILSWLFCQGIAAEPPQLRELQEAVVAITDGGTDAKDIVGTGFFISSDGLVVTADHVVPRDAKTVVILHREQGGKVFRPHEAEVIARYRNDPDQPRDIAILRITQPPLSEPVPYFAIGTPARVGDDVFVGGMGRPPAIDRAVRPLWRKGVVASAEYRIRKVPVLVVMGQSN